MLTAVTQQGFSVRLRGRGVERKDRPAECPYGVVSMLSDVHVLSITK